MDTLHTVLRSIRGEAKAGRGHLKVFREFLSHLDRINRKAPVKPARTRLAPRQPPRRGAR